MPDDSIRSKIIAINFSMASEIERDLISALTTKTLWDRKAKTFKQFFPSKVIPKPHILRVTRFGTRLFSKRNRLFMPKNR
jgi:hypothetical protein